MGEHSTTATITNQTVFSSRQLLEKLPDLIDPQNPPPHSLLPTFLHEATHHWCFTSPVGTTIVILQMRGLMSALRALEATNLQEAKVWEERAADDIVRAEVAWLLLQPLAEGMATFAEFDLSVSMRSPVVPPPLRWAILFSARDKLTGSPDSRVRRRMDLAMSTAVALMQGRLSERSRRAKEALFVEPLSCQKSSGYLAGYLLMKTFWRFMQSHHERFNEPELFLLKVYDIFYQDAEFVRLLVDPSRRIPDALNPLVEHLANRLAYTLSDVKDSLDDFFKSLASARSELYERTDADGRVLPLSDPVDSDPSARFRAIWDELMGDPIYKIPDDSAGWFRLQSAIMSMHMIGYGRDFLELGAFEARLIAAETETVVQVKGEAIARLSTISGAPIGETDGTVHILLNTRSGEYIVVASSGQFALIALQRTSEAAEVDDTALRRSILGRLHGATIAGIFMQNAQDDPQRLRELTRLADYLKQTRERLDALYLPLATNYVPVSKLEELIPKIVKDGIYGVFDYNADLVRALAIIGSMAHMSLSPELLKPEFEKYGLDYDSSMEKLHEYSRSTNLFWLSDGLFVRSSL